MKVIREMNEEVAPIVHAPPSPRGSVDITTELVIISSNKKTTKKESSLRMREFIEKTHEPLAVPREKEKNDLKLNGCCTVC